MAGKRHNNKKKPKPQKPITAHPIGGGSLSTTHENQSTPELEVGTKPAATPAERRLKQAVFGLCTFGLGLLSNNISSDPRIAFITAAAFSTGVIWCFRRRGAVAWLVALFICAALFIGGSKYVSYKLKETPCVVTLEPGQSLNQRKPFETRFILRNQSSFPIHDIEYWRTWIEGRPLPEGRILFGGPMLSGIRKIDPFSQATLSISFEGSATDKMYLHRPITHSAIMQIGVSYRTEFSKTRTEAEFCFYTVEDSDGHYRWFPAPVQTNSPTLALPLIPFDPANIVPLIAYKSFSVEQVNPKTNDGHALRIHHLIQNQGGVAAKDLFVEWTVRDKVSGSVYGWTNRQTVFQKTALYLPGGPVQDTWEDCTDNFTPSLFQGLDCGELYLVGELHYKDPTDHEYGMTITANRTNNEFKVTCNAYSGYFQELRRELIMGPKATP